MQWRVVFVDDRKTVSRRGPIMFYSAGPIGMLHGTVESNCVLIQFCHPSITQA
jgi:hypothetical protein